MLPLSRDDDRRPQAQDPPVEHDVTRLTADRLEGALASDSSARPEAVRHLQHYVSLLRQPIPAGRPRIPHGRFLCKLQLGDGRWDLRERELERLPAPGEELCFDDGTTWVVARTEDLARARGPATPRPMVVCLAA